MVLEIGSSSELPSRQSNLTLYSSICDKGVSLIIVELVG